MAIARWHLPLVYLALMLVISVVSQPSYSQSIRSGSTVVNAAVYEPNPNYRLAAPATGAKSDSLSTLRSAIERGRTSLAASRLPDPKAAKQRLIDEMVKFERYLRATGPDNATAWFKFLKWKELLAELAAKEPNLRNLTDVELRYRQNVLGLEYAPYQDMRLAISNYIDAQRFGSNPEGTIKVLDSQLEKLLKATDSTSELTELERMRDIGQMATFLSSANQAPDLIKAIKSAYSQPNIRVMVGESFVNRIVGRPVAQPNPVDECVLGTRVLGNSFISGNVMADLLPRTDGVSMRLVLNGNFSSDNIGYNRGVKVYTTGSSPIYASKTITITPTGTFSEPAVASTNLQSQINSIEHRLRIVRRIASRKAAEQQPEANAIGQGRLETRLARQFNDQIEEQLKQNNGAANGLKSLDQDRVELRRLGVPKPTWSLQSSNSHILADFKEADATQLAAPTASPLPKSSTDIVAELHQSLPINLAASVLGGRTLHSWEMDDLLRQYTADVPAELIKESEGKPWSLTFADHHPVEVEFTGGLAVISLRITKMSNGEQTLDDPATVTAKYRPVLSNGFLVLERQGEVDLRFARASGGLRSVALRSFFKGKFDKLFKERSDPRSISFPTRIPNVSQLTINNITFDKGWAQVTLR